MQHQQYFRIDGTSDQAIFGPFVVRSMSPECMVAPGIGGALIFNPFLLALGVQPQVVASTAVRSHLSN
jgi:hypothetical protein